MSAKDVYHSAVRSALIKEGWTITHDPLTVEFEDVTLFVDLGAEQVIAAERGAEKIAVEIKSFIRESMVSEFHAAAGQFINYRLALSEYVFVPNNAEISIVSQLIDLVFSKIDIVLGFHSPFKRKLPEYAWNN
jgi:hypothetical protein